MTTPATAPDIGDSHVNARRVAKAATIAIALLKGLGWLVVGIFTLVSMIFSANHHAAKHRHGKH